MVKPTAKVFNKGIVYEWVLGIDEVGDPINVYDFSKVDIIEIDSISGSGSFRAYDQSYDENLPYTVAASVSVVETYETWLVRKSLNIAASMPWVRPKVVNAAGHTGTLVYRFYCYW